MTGGNNQRALLYEVIKRKQAQLHDDLSSHAPADGFAPTPEQSVEGAVQICETRIYIGLNDSDTKKQIFDTDKYMGVLKDVCRNYRVAFSVDIEEGGYYHDDGEYIEETAFVLVLVDADREIVKEIATDLCTFFHQESVLVTEDYLTGYFIESLLT